jgi:hypothetical protein
MLCAEVSRISFQAGDGGGDRDRTITSETRSRSNLLGSNLSPYGNVLRSVGIPYDYAVRINLTYLILLLNRRNGLRRNILQLRAATAEFIFAQGLSKRRDISRRNTLRSDFQQRKYVRR